MIYSRKSRTDAVARSLKHISPLAVRLAQANAMDLSDTTIEYAMRETSAPNTCIAMARMLRDAGLLTMDYVREVAAHIFEGEAAKTRIRESGAISVAGGSPGASPTVPTQIAGRKATQREAVSGEPAQLTLLGAP